MAQLQGQEAVAVCASTGVAGIHAARQWFYELLIARHFAPCLSRTPQGRGEAEVQFVDHSPCKHFSAMEGCGILGFWIHTFFELSTLSPNQGRWELDVSVPSSLDCTGVSKLISSPF